MTIPDREPDRDFPIIALVCSAGGLAALRTVLADLPDDLPAAVVALQHISPHRRSLLPEILRRSTAMSVTRAENGAALVRGRVYVAPEAAHVIVGTDTRLRLISADGAPRPSADLLLCTLAVAMGRRAIAVVLTGGGRDGAIGAATVDLFGGTTLIQDPSTADTSGMPEAVLVRNRPAAILPLSAIGPALVALVRHEPLPDGEPAPVTFV